MKEALAEAEKRRAANQEKLAKELDVSVEKLQAALDAIKKKNLDQAVKDNHLTAEQRDAILACEKAPLTCDRSNLPAYGFGGGPGHFGGPGVMIGPGAGLRVLPAPKPGAGPRLRHFREPIAASSFVKDLAAELGISEDKVTAALKATRPALPKGELRRFEHGPGGPDHDFVPPPEMDGAAVPVAPPEVPAPTA
jgi:hypothetical protein